MIHLRIVVPGQADPGLLALLRDDPRTANLVVLPGCAIDPDGDLILLDVAREATTDVIAQMRHHGLDEHASIAIQDVDAIYSTAADRAEKAAPGSRTTGSSGPGAAAGPLGRPILLGVLHVHVPGDADRRDRRADRLLRAGGRRDGGRAGVRPGRGDRRRPRAAPVLAGPLGRLPAAQRVRGGDRGHRPGGPGGQGRGLATVLRSPDGGFLFGLCERIVSSDETGQENVVGGVSRQAFPAADAVLVAAHLDHDHPGRLVILAPAGAVSVRGGEVSAPVKDRLAILDVPTGLSDPLLSRDVTAPLIEALDAQGRVLDATRPIRDPPSAVLR